MMTLFRKGYGVVTLSDLIFVYNDIYNFDKHIIGLDSWICARAGAGRVERC